MYLSLEIIIAMLSVVGAILFFAGYRCGRSDQVDANIRAGYAQMFRRGRHNGN